MTRILSALVLLPVVLGTVWYLPPVATLGLAEAAALVAFIEYADLASHLGAPFPRVLAGTAVLVCCAALGLGLAPVADILLAALIAVAAAAVGFGRPGPTVLPGVAAALFAPLYLGLPLGALVAVRAVHGRGAVVALMLTVMVSDSAQY
jgi:CDP-diglyceride synthetase